MKKTIGIGILLTFVLGFSMIGTTRAVTYTKIWATPARVDRGTVYDLWIEDTDNDTKDEIIAAAYYRVGVWVYETDGDDSFAEVFNWTATTTWYSVTVGDADQDGKKEIIGGGREGEVPHYVWALEWTGVEGQNNYEVVWNNTFNAFVEGVSVTDLDKDGAREIVVATGADELGNIEGIVRVFESTGDNTYTLEWSFDVTTVGAGGIRGMAVGDIDNDGWIEIAVETYAHMLVLNSSTHQATPHLEWGPIALSSPPGAWGAIDVSIEKNGLSQDLDNDGFKEIVVGSYDRVSIYENLGPDSYSSTPVEIVSAGTNYNIEVDIAWDLDNNTKNELLCGGSTTGALRGVPGNVSIFEFGTTLEDFTLVWTMTIEQPANSIRASERFCHYDLDQEIKDLTKDKGYWEFAVGLDYTAIEDLVVYESDVLAGHIPEFPTWPLILVMLLAITMATIPVRRRIRP